MFKPTLIVLITILEKWWCDKQALSGVWFGFLCSISVRKFPKARAGYAAIRGGDREASALGTTSSTQSPHGLEARPWSRRRKPRHQDQFQC
ncbi:hypothetical protein LCBD_2185 [Lacticaseibacillus paracasei]|nr:hypothetical protein LCBD_2185 [Lacticaseibacillus paracasei]